MLNNQKNIIVDKYNIYGNVIHIHSSNKRILKTIYKYWKSFYSKRCLLKPKVIFYLTEYNVIDSIRKNQFFYNDNFSLVLDSHKCIICNLYRVPWQVYIQASDINDTDSLYATFEPTFINILKRLNLFRLHSAAVTKDGFGIMLPGASNSGKTTIALALLKSGFKILTDERSFLLKTISSIYVLGFDEEIFITDKTISFFPELKFLKRTPTYKRGAQFKRRLEIGKIYPNSIAKKTKVYLLVFPKIIADQKTRIEPLSKENALIKILNQVSASSHLKDTVALTNQFDLFSRLVQSVKTYNLFIGKQIDDIPRLISELL